MKKPLIILILIALLVLALVVVLLAFSAFGTLDQSIWTPDPAAAPSVSGTVSGGSFSWDPGTYTGVGAGGFGGDITVEVVIDDSGSLASVTITHHSDTQSFVDMAEAQVVAAMVANQTMFVDTFSGATMTSQAIINAVENALADAGGVAAAGGGGGAPLDLTPGTYTGVGTGGFGGDITVEVVIDDSGSIASITVTNHSETQAFMDMAETQVAGAILAGQTTNVDTFAGATLSSQALIEAVESALAAAG